MQRMMLRKALIRKNNYRIVIDIIKVVHVATFNIFNHYQSIF